LGPENGDQNTLVELDVGCIWAFIAWEVYYHHSEQQ